MEKQVIKLTESDLHNIIEEVVKNVLDEINIIRDVELNKVYWICKFVGDRGDSKWKIFHARSGSEAKMRVIQVGFHIGMRPDYSTLRNATEEEAKKFQERIRRRV